MPISRLEEDLRLAREQESRPPEREGNPYLIVKLVLSLALFVALAVGGPLIEIAAVVLAAIGFVVVVLLIAAYVEWLLS